MQPGSELAGYRIERVLATGGTCTVYLAHDPVLPRLDALKVLNPDLSTDAGARERFIRESDTGARLHHPNIVAIYSRGEAEDGQLWIAMQYVAGTDAEAALASGSMNPTRALRIVKYVAKALDYAHRLDLVHSDVKPSNVLLSPDTDSDDEHVLLSDFGISRTVGQSRHDAPLTLSLAYAAPEVIVGGEVDGSADIYSLGCTLFRLLTGKHVFSQAAGTSGLVDAHLRQPPPRISDVMSGFSPQLDAVVAKALAKDPRQRFVTAREFAEAAAEALPRLTGLGPTARFLPPPATAASGPRMPDPAAMNGPSPTGGQWPPEPGAPPRPSAWTASGGPAPRLRPYVRRSAFVGRHMPRGVLLAGGAAFAAIALTVGIVATTNYSSPAPPPATTAKPSPTLSLPPRPDPAAQARLAGLLPAGYPPGTCSPGGVTASETAVALCGPNADPGGPTSASYTLVKNTQALQSALDQIIHTTTPTICPPNILSPGAWHRVENPTAPMGIVFCGLRGGLPLVAWTNEPELLVCETRGAASGPPLDQLFTWWTSHS